MSRGIRRAAHRAGRPPRPPRLIACVTSAVLVGVLGGGTSTALAATVNPSANSGSAGLRRLHSKQDHHGPSPADDRYPDPGLG